MKNVQRLQLALGLGYRVPTIPDYPAMPPGRAMQPAHVALGAPFTFPFPLPPLPRYS